MRRLNRVIPSNRIMLFTATLLILTIAAELLWQVTLTHTDSDPLFQRALLLGGAFLLTLVPVLVLSLWLLSIARQADRHS